MAIYVYQCFKFGKQARRAQFPKPKYGGKCQNNPPAGNHVWQQVAKE